MRAALAIVALCGLPGCLVLADAPTSIKRLHAEPSVEVAGLVDGATVTGAIDITATRSSDLELRGGGLVIDGTTVAGFDHDALAYTWDTRSSPHGDVAVEVWTIDEIGRRTSRVHDVLVNQPPTVAFELPAAPLSGAVVIAATAYDDDAVQGVRLAVDGDQIATDASAPFSLPLDTCDFAAGAHVLTVVAADRDGSETTATADATFATPIDVQLAMATRYTVPSDTLVADVAWDEGIDAVRFEVDGAELATVHDPGTASCDLGCASQCREVSVPWDTTALAEGEHVVTVLFTDVSGDQRTDSAAFIVDHDRDGDGAASVGYGGSDCDDLSAAIHPSAIEHCDGKDEDCSGRADDPFDVDRDGFPAGQSCGKLGTDCDDTRSDVHPGAPDACGDGVDYDCGGPAPCRLVNGTAATVTIQHPDLDFGHPIGVPGDVNGDGVDDLAVSARVHDASNGTAGAVYVFDGSGASGTVLTPANALATARESWGTNDRFGYAALGLGDLDGDGKDEYAITASSSLPTPVFHGGDGSFVESDAWAYVACTGALPADAGDIDGDGSIDVLVGNQICLGPIVPGDGIPAAITFDAYAPAATIRADLDGDGHADIVLGDYAANKSNGRVYVYFDAPRGSIAYADADVIIDGSVTGGQFGGTVGPAGDTDGDGRDDLLVSAFAAKTTSVFATPWAPISDATDAAVVFQSTDCAAPVGGLNADGDDYADIAFGCRTAVRVLYGPFAGTVSATTGGAYVTSPGPGVTLFAGDFDGNGIDDLVYGEDSKDTSIWRLRSAL